jgi:hypothetical protein
METGADPGSANGDEESSNLLNSTVADSYVSPDQQNLSDGAR